jgi:hypothetical protein
VTSLCLLGVASYPCQSAPRAGFHGAELTLILPGGPNVMRHSRSEGGRVVAFRNNVHFPNTRAASFAPRSPWTWTSKSSASPQRQYLALREVESRPVATDRQPPNGATGMRPGWQYRGFSRRPPKRALMLCKPESVSPRPQASNMSAYIGNLSAQQRKLRLRWLLEWIEPRDKVGRVGLRG